VPLPKPVAARYERYGVQRDWTAVNIPPDLPTVGRIISELYEQTTGDRIDGVIAADPLAVTEILRVAGPVQAGGVRLDAGNVAEETLVRAYIRYEADNAARRRFLEELARASFRAFQRGLATKPIELLRAWGRPPAAGTCRSTSATRPPNGPCSASGSLAAPSPLRPATT
jgi:hypothetical protein